MDKYNDVLERWELFLLSKSIDSPSTEYSLVMALEIALGELLPYCEDCDTKMLNLWLPNGAWSGISYCPVCTDEDRLQVLFDSVKEKVI